MIQWKWSSHSEEKKQQFYSEAQIEKKYAIKIVQICNLMQK